MLRDKRKIRIKSDYDGCVFDFNGINQFLNLIQYSNFKIF